MAVMEEAVEDGGGDRRVPEDLPPFTEAFVGGQDDAPVLASGRDQLEEDRGGRPVVRPDPELVDDENLWT